MRSSLVCLIVVASIVNLGGQESSSPQPLGLRMPQFLAISVPDLDAASKWYAQMFRLDTVRDLPSPDGQSRTRVLSSPELIVELSQHATARSLREYAGAPTPTFQVHGFFKAGMFVADLERTVATLRQRGITGIGGIQSDDALRLRWVLFRDDSGNFLQLLERRAQ